MGQLSIVAASLVVTLMAQSALAAPAKAASSGRESWELGTIDFGLQPKVGLGIGDYKIGDIDKGTYSDGVMGMRGFLKLGPVLVGGEYMESSILGQSKVQGISTADRISYPSIDGARHQTWGFSSGLLYRRFILWYNYYGYNRIKRNPVAGMEEFNFVYLGSGHSVELNVMIVKGIYLAAYHRSQAFDRYSSSQTSNLKKNEELGSKLEMSEWGGFITLMLPFSEANLDIIKKFTQK